MPHNYSILKNNIPNKKEVKQAFNAIKNRLNTKHFIFLISKRYIKSAGLCVILSKKHIQKANKRNLCRRIIKESFRLNKNFLNYKILIALSKQKITAQATKEELWQSIIKLEHFLQENF